MLITPWLIYSPAYTLRGYQSLKDVSVPTLQTGLFALPQRIPCAGTLTTLTARGYCIADESRDGGGIVLYRMTLHIVRMNPDSGFYETIPSYITPISGPCVNGTGRFNKNHLDLTVLTGDLIAVEVTNCTTEGNMLFCPFLPVGATPEETSSVIYSEDLDFNTTEELTGLLLTITADIDPSKLYIHKIVTKECLISL